MADWRADKEAYDRRALQEHAARLRRILATLDYDLSKLPPEPEVGTWRLEFEEKQRELARK